MESIGVRELRQHASRYLDAVAAGESIVITDRGRPVARLVPITGDTWQDLVRTGEVVEGAEKLRLDELTPIEAAFDISAHLDEIRSGER
ncbi:type II toxin-antitoxin system Phd/YefM family antitoxin [Mycobacterium sp. C31M]